MSEVFDLPIKSATHKIVLLALANFADDDGANVFPSKATLSRKCSLSERAVFTVCGEFISQGVLVAVEERTGKPTIYRLNLAPLTSNGMNVVQTALDAPLNDVHTKVCTSFIEGMHVVQEGYAPGADNTSVNHQVTIKEPSVKKRATPKKEISLSEVYRGWPILALEDGPWTVPEPFGSDDRAKAALHEWMRRRLLNKKGLPTVYGMNRSNAGWWPKYSTESVILAIEAAASSGWQGIIEDVAAKSKTSEIVRGGNSRNGSTKNLSVAEMADAVKRDLLGEDYAQRTNT